MTDAEYDKFYQNQKEAAAHQVGCTAANPRIDPYTFEPIKFSTEKQGHELAEAFMKGILRSREEK